jgi:epoxyqueuosine reductase QueG
LLTPEFGPRVLLTLVLTSADVAPDRPLEHALCAGPSCGRCLCACPGDVIGHWERDWPACDRYRSPHGFQQVSEFLGAILESDDIEEQKRMVRSETSFNIWQSTLRGAGVMTGCRRCQDVCPVGADYALLEDALDTIPETTDAKRARLAAMEAAEAAGDYPESYRSQQRWIGRPAD